MHFHHPGSGNDVFQQLQKITPFIQARLSRRLALGVFASIVLIEIVLLVPSALRRERELLTQIEQSTVEFTALATRALPSELGEAELFEKLTYVFQDFALGGSLYNQNTRALVGQFGEIPSLSLEQASRVDSLYQGDRYDIVLPLPQRQDYILVLRQDSSIVQREVTAFVLRVAGLVAIISIVVTGSTMIILGLTVITPILKLRQNLLDVGQTVSRGEMPPAFVPPENLPNNELGEVIGAFQQMSGQVLASIKERQAAEASLKEANEQLEARVVERTQAVDEKNQSLIRTLLQLEAAQEELVKSERQAALGQLVAGIAHELNTPLGAMQASAGNIIHDLKLLPEVLPQLWQDLTSENKTQFAELVEQATQRQAFLSARDRRQLRKQLEEKLTLEGINNPREVAEICLDLGIQDRYQRYIPLLASPENIWLRQFIQQTCNLHANSRVISTAVGRASKIVFALKSYAQVHLNEEREATDLTISIYKALSLYPSQLSYGVKVTRRYERLPLVWCYPNALIQVWANLLHNALQAIEGDGEIIISVQAEGDFAVVSFEDSGPGIPEAIQERIFEPFFTTRPTGEGSGLGLGMCQQVVEQHGGYMEMTSQPGTTVFTVRLPLEPDLELT